MLFVRDFLTDQVVHRSDLAPDTPLVSVVLPTYRRGRNGMLERAIQSVLQQTFADLELLVIDDGSTDGSFDLIERYRATDPRVVHVRHERNSGIHSVRLNEGIELARGKYIAFQFDDDYWRPNALRLLVGEGEGHREPTVVFGRSVLKIGNEERRLPDGDVTILSLYRENQIGNNNVLLPRELVDQLGMYDCHLGMRRLCDWDLWLRYCREVPFVLVDQITTEVNAAQANSIGLTVPYDLALFRYLHDIPRNQVLVPARWHDYQVDALRIGDVETEKEFRKRLYEEHFVPYYLNHRHRFPKVEGFSATVADQPKTGLLVRNWYGPTHEIAFNHYDPVTTRRGTYKAYYQQVDQIPAISTGGAPSWTREADAVLLVRSVETEAKRLAAEALQKGIPLGYYLDDDLLTLSDYGTEYADYAPGAPLYQNLTDLLSKSDAVWCNTRPIAKSVQSFNPRTIPHHICVAEEWLPTNIRPRHQSRPLRIGYGGTAYRLEEFKQLWDALMRVSKEFGEKLAFEFWGLDVSSLPPLASPITYRPYNPSFVYYMQQLKRADVDVMLTPLLEYPQPRLGKSIAKYLQTAAAGALGIFSDVPQYAALPGGLTCLKPKNNAEAWYEALREAITMPPEQFDLMRRRMIEHVREEFTETAQIHLYEAAWRATEFHAKTRAARHADGRPRVMYVLHSPNLGGGEIQLWRRLRLARLYGMEPIVVLARKHQSSAPARQISQALDKEGIQLEFVDYTCFTEPHSPDEFCNEEERAQVRELFTRCKPALVHTVIFIPTFGQICQELKIPHVSSQYAVDEGFEWKEAAPELNYCQIVQSDSIRYTTRWSNLLRAERICSRELVPEPVFRLGQARYLESVGKPQPAFEKRVRMTVTGTLQARKRQLEIIRAIGRLVREGSDCQLDIYGYTHLIPEYTAQCEEQVRALNLEDRVVFHGFTDDVVQVLKSADLILSLSTFESFPSAIKEAMAGGVLVVATPVGGIPELIVDGVSGILCADTSEEAITDGIRRALLLTPAERSRIVEQARRVARSEFHPQRVASDLMLMYNRAIDLTKGQGAVAPRPDLGHSSLPAKHDQVIEPRQPPSSVIPLDRSLKYRVTPSHDDWAGIDVLVGTHQRRVTGRIILYVLSPSGQLLRESSADLGAVGDNSWLGFRFEALAHTAGRPLILDFRRTEAEPQARVSFYDTESPGVKTQRMLGRLLRWTGIGAPRDSLYRRMWYNGQDAK